MRKYQACGPVLPSFFYIPCAVRATNLSILFTIIRIKNSTICPNVTLYYEWKQARSAEMNALRAGLQKTAGFRCVPMTSNQSDIFWMNNWHMNRDCSKVKDQTETELNTRATMRETLAYLKEAVPVAFRNAYNAEKSK